MSEPILHNSRLEAARLLLGEYDSVADIGCDHGKLALALALDSTARRVIAVDISEPSLEKTRRLAQKYDLEDRIVCRKGDGLSVLGERECSAIAILGMGGKLIKELLAAAKTPLMGAKIAVLQPMRGELELREWLHKSGYHITTDLVLYDMGRLYQLFAVEYRGYMQSLPQGFPEACYELGFVAAERHEPRFFELLTLLIQRTERSLSELDRGSNSEAQRSRELLCQRLERLLLIRNNYYGTNGGNDNES